MTADPSRYCQTHPFVRCERQDLVREAEQLTERVGRLIVERDFWRMRADVLACQVRELRRELAKKDKAKWKVDL